MLAKLIGWVFVVLNVAIVDKNTAKEVKMRAGHEITDICKWY
jgi:hypothetical protein